MSRNGRHTRYLLAGCAAVEIALFAWLVLSKGGVFPDFVLTADSGYLVIARHLVETGSLLPTTRTLGYPLFLTLGYLIGGMHYAVHVVIALQLMINILLAYGVWRFLERTASGTGTIVPVLAFVFFFVAGLGMALQVMTDFLAAALFFVFLYGMLFWRRRLSLFLSAPALFLATLTRPTFTFLPFLLPFAAIAAGGFRRRVPRGHLAVFIAASLAATGISMWYQYTSYGYPGPSSVVGFNLKTTMYHALAVDRMTKPEYLAELEGEIASRAGRPYAELSKREEERITRELFVEALRDHPARIVSQMALTFLKYLFAPVESLVARFWSLGWSRETYRSYGRIVLFLVCLPAWILSVIPPPGAPGDRRAYYAVMMLFLVYVLGISVIAPVQGERMRFPVLALMLPVMVWNAAALRERIAWFFSSTLTYR